MSCHEEYYLAMLSIEQENDKKKKELLICRIHHPEWCFMSPECDLEVR